MEYYNIVSVAVNSVAGAYLSSVRRYYATTMSALVEICGDGVFEVESIPECTAFYMTTWCTIKWIRPLPTPTPSIKIPIIRIT